jgi:type IV secretory pathway VirB10-like protein
MAKKLKTFVTSMGFFDLAVAAPSMKAAMEAWGVKRNLFHLGAASETGDRAIIAAAMAKPGTVLKRPVGTSEPFHEDAALPAGFSLPPVKEAPAPKTKAPPKAKKAKPRRAEKHTGEKHIGDNRAAIISFEKARAERERARAKEEAAAKRDAQKRASAVEKAQTQLEDARQAHQERRDKLTRELESRMKDEETRWNQERRKLEAALDKARKS